MIKAHCSNDTQDKMSHFPLTN